MTIPPRNRERPLSSLRFRLEREYGDALSVAVCAYCGEANRAGCTRLWLNAGPVPSLRAWSLRRRNLDDPVCFDTVANAAAH